MFFNTSLDLGSVKVNESLTSLQDEQVVETEVDKVYV